MSAESKVIRSPLRINRWKVDFWKGSGRGPVGKADWAWVKKKASPSDLRISIRPSLENVWAEPRYYDSSDLKAAEKDVVQLIESGKADNVFVDKQARVNGFIGTKQYYNEWVSIESQTFSSA